MPGSGAGGAWEREPDMGKRGAPVAALVCVFLTLALGGPASADLAVGANDDAGKYEGGLSWFYPTMASTGLSVNAITLRWDETAPTTIAMTRALIQAVPGASRSTSAC